MISATAEHAKAAAARIATLIEHTPLVRSSSFSDELGADVWFKLENRQTTGSFKLRGASNRLLTLSEAQRERGCVAASSGNHGAAVASAAQQLGVDCVVFVPEHTSPTKVEKIRHFGGEVRFFGTDGLDTEEHARAFAEEHGRFYLSPYNDEQVVAGQGTCGIEIIEALPALDAVFVAVGGGGLVGGVGSVLKERDAAIRVYGCQPLASPVMARSIEAGKILDLPSDATLSDGTAGGIEQGSLTFPLNQAVVDDWVVVDEAAIAAAMRRYIDSEGDIIEGAAGVAVAGLLERRNEIAGKTVVVMVCGGNVSAETLQKVRRC